MDTHLEDMKTALAQVERRVKGLSELLEVVEADGRNLENAGNDETHNVARLVSANSSFIASASKLEEELTSTMGWVQYCASVTRGLLERSLSISSAAKQQDIPGAPPLDPQMHTHG